MRERSPWADQVVLRSCQLRASESPVSPKLAIWHGKEASLFRIFEAARGFASLHEAPFLLTLRRTFDFTIPDVNQAPSSTKLVPMDLLRIRNQLDVVEHRQVQADDHGTDAGAHDHGQERLEHRGQVVDRHLDLLS